MVKKIIILPLLFCVATIISISCGNNCKDLASKNFSLLKNGKINVQTNSGFLVSNQTITLDTLQMQIGYVRDCVVKSKVNNFSLFNSAYAWSKINCTCGEKGFKSPLTKLVFTASQNFNGIAAGQSINNFVKVYINDFLSSSSGLLLGTPNAFVDSLNVRTARNEYLYYSASNFVAIIPTKPSPAFTGAITANYIFNTADTVKASTVNFSWQ